jgi:hypothetical protein
LAFGLAPFRRGGTSELIESERNRLSCADRAFLDYERKRQPFLAYAAVSRDADCGAWCAAAVRAFAIVTGTLPVTTGLLA